MSEVQEFVEPSAPHPPRALAMAPLLEAIAAQASDADATRSVSPEVIAKIKASDVMRFSASTELGGLEASVFDIARELEATAGACSSTAWCLWNHLCVFHFYCGAFGPPHLALLRGITESHEWVSLPAGAGSQVIGKRDGDRVLLNGRAAFSSGARYGEWAGVVFVFEHETQTQPLPLRLGLVRSDQPGVRVDPTWEAMSLRASATDHIVYDDVAIPADRVVDFSHKYRESYRRPDYPVISERYREDWVGLSDLWLGAMAVGLSRAALDEVCSGIRDRIAIFGTKMAQRPTIHVNLGQASSAIAAARASVERGCRETDERIAAATPPTESHYLRQLSASMTAIQLCDDAMRLMLRVMGGNGLREGPSFERRYRDFQAMPLHINAHVDRVSEQLGRHLLGLETDNPF